MAEVTKNKITGKYRNVQFKVFDNYGVDDVDSCISFLVKEGFWKQSGSFIVPEGLYEEKFQRKKLIETIEEKNHESKLSHLVAKKWKEIEDALKINRKERFE